MHVHAIRVVVCGLTRQGQHHHYQWIQTTWFSIIRNATSTRAATLSVVTHKSHWHTLKVIPRWLRNRRIFAQHWEHHQIFHRHSFNSLYHLVVQWRTVRISLCLLISQPSQYIGRFQWQLITSSQSISSGKELPFLVRWIKLIEHGPSMSKDRWWCQFKISNFLHNPHCLSSVVAVEHIWGKTNKQQFRKESNACRISMKRLSSLLNSIKVTSWTLNMPSVMRLYSVKLEIQTIGINHRVVVN